MNVMSNFAARTVSGWKGEPRSVTESIITNTYPRHGRLDTRFANTSRRRVHNTPCLLGTSTEVTLGFH